MRKLPRYGLILFIFLCIMVAWVMHQKSAKQSNWQEVKRGPIISAIYGLGTVTSGKVYHLKVVVTAHIKNIYVHEGDEVKVGQPLVLFDTLPLFKAPFAGTITALPLNHDETVYPNTAVLTLMDLHDRYILVSLEQESAIKINKGQKVKLSFSGLPNQSFDGTVTSIYPKDQESYVKITVNNLPPSILPQMSADVSIILDQKDNALLIPTQAIQNSSVTLRRQGKTIKTPIELGAINDDYAEIATGDIQAGDFVLVKS